MPLPGKVERPQRVTRSRRIKAESNAAAPFKASTVRLRSRVWDAWLSCAVLKLDTEGDGAASPRKVSRTVGRRGAATVFYSRGGDVQPWTTDQVDRTIGSRGAALVRAASARWARRTVNQQEVRVVKKILAFLMDFGRNRTWLQEPAFHDDSLRANQGQNTAPAFSFWRALVS
jgi:hypothetical protein